MNRKRLLLVGGTGLIGRELAEPLRLAGFETFFMARTPRAECGLNDGGYVFGDIFDSSFVRDVMRKVQPTHLLNLAWCTTGDYLTSPRNEQYLEAGVQLADAFAENGGRRAVYAGTCFEYALEGSDFAISEDAELDVGKNAYTKAKNELRIRSEEILKRAGVSFAFGRIFYVYGRGEAKSRLTGMVIDKLRQGLPVVIKSGPLLKDYVYSRDVAGAFSALLDSEVTGVVNICTGHAISIHEYVSKIAERMKRTDLVSFEDDCAGQPACIVGDNTRLRSEVGYAIRWTVDQALDEILRT